MYVLYNIRSLEKLKYKQYHLYINISGGVFFSHYLAEHSLLEFSLVSIIFLLCLIISIITKVKLLLSMVISKTSGYTKFEEKSRDTPSTTHTISWLSLISTLSLSDSQISSLFFSYRSLFAWNNTSLIFANLSSSEQWQ